MMIEGYSSNQVNSGILNCQTKDQLAFSANHSQLSEGQNGHCY
jgi:hypothetical protein